MELAKISVTLTAVTVWMATRVPTAIKRSMNANQLLVKMEQSAKTLLELINANAPKDSKDKTANSTSMTACPTRVKTAALAMIS